MQTKKFVEPLLYISQPKFEKVVVNMQEDYRGDGEDITIVKTKKNNINNKSSNISFKNLTILERINYLCNLPLEIPPLRCEVKTERSTYRGTIKQQLEDEISVHVLGRGNEIIQKTDIKSINLIGF